MSMAQADVEHNYAERRGDMLRLIGLRDSLPSDADAAVIKEVHAALSADDPQHISPGKLLAALLLMFPHELPHPYRLEALPPWLRYDYLAYTLVGPSVFRNIGEAEIYFDRISSWVDYLHDNVVTRINEDLWRHVGLFFTQRANFIPTYFNNRNVRELYRKRAAIIETTMRAVSNRLDYTFAPRPRRKRMRVGVLAVHYLPLTETYATLPFYQHLDRTKFEVFLFALKQGKHPLEQFCARHADRFMVLPPDLGQAVQALRDAQLDCIMVGTNTTAVTNEIALLALHRLAPVQITSICSSVTSGMSNMDYYLSGRLTEPTDAQSHYTEKLVLVDGPAHCFSFGNEFRPAGTERMDRKQLGIPEDGVVFTSGANLYKILPEVEEVWMRILAAVPRSYLILYPFNPNWSNVYPVNAFAQRLKAAVERYGVDCSRIVVLRAAPHRGDLLARLRLADVYLDSFPYCGATSLLDPLEVGLPIVAMDGGPARTLQAASLLRALNMDELIASNVDGYIELAVRLAEDVNFRTQVRGRIEQGMVAGPRFLDSKGYGAKVARALEFMWKDSKHHAQRRR